jgi:hypothetical protein
MGLRLLAIGRRRRAAASALIVMVVSSACAAHHVDQLMQDWHGRRLRELVATWGPPRYAYADGGGGHVLIYVPDSESRLAAAQPILRSGAELADRLVRGATLESEPAYPPAITGRWRVFRAFFIDANDKIYRSQWKGKWDCCGT